MIALAAIKYITPEEYLEAEEKSLVKHEYYQGEVFAMAGASQNHNRLVRDCMITVGNFLENKSCEIFPGDLRIQVEVRGLFSYPDLSIFCNPVDAYKNRTDTATNPTVIIEVLSPSTEDYDRGSKFMLCRDLPSLKEYILISSTQMLVEKYTRQSNTEWQFSEYKNPADQFEIEAIGFTIAVENLYRKVNFNEE